MKEKALPQHIAIILDGNGRWAQMRSLTRTKGHIEGVKRVEEIVDIARLMGIKVVTLFTFSTENWRRPQDEVSIIMSILMAVLNRKMQKLKNDNIQLRMIGQRERVSTKVLTAFEKVVEDTKKNTGMIVNLAFNYGSRLEIIDAVKRIVSDIQSGELSESDINEEAISQRLYTAGLPDPDLLIRTSGEQRISNFLLWQLSYTELYFTEKLWPDFTVEEFKKAIAVFQRRERRYGASKALKGEEQ